jgi:asparagine synthase (glutamine-hydrolysing)
VSEGITTDLCGITGFFDQKTQQPDAVIKRMTDAIVHRGPDDEGHWLDRDAGIALGHRRLSILDLSPAGHQPMHSVSGRYVIVFNGEIYNHEAIRRELEQAAPCSWRGHSDTEVMLEALETWGVEATLKRLTGMFAIALWDCRERLLHLVRDRIGEKPLYYGWQGSTFLFGSELKALCAHPDWHGEVNRDALTLYLRHNYIPAPYSIYQGIYKLIPGTMLTLRLARDAIGTLPPPMPYWTFNQAVTDGKTAPFSGTDAEAANQLESLLRDAVRQQMEADVPLGAFLSGGVDSSTIVALMQAQSRRPVKTFTIGFSESDYDEAPFAKEVARHLGTDHTEMFVTPDDALDVIPHLPSLYDEPFSDPSQIPTFLVSQLTRRHVTVSLSGDAGDELFGGYNRYFIGRTIWNRISWVPSSIRSLAAKGVTAFSPSMWDNASLFMPNFLRFRAFGDRMHKLAEVIPSTSPNEMYRNLVSHWKAPSDIVLHGSEPYTILTDSAAWPDLPDFTEQMMYLDTLSYLPDDILVKVDRAAMGVSLETRVPFLDHRVVEFAWRLPLAMKIRNGQGKWLLRQVLYKYVPQGLIERPKVGFGVPIDSWLRGPLREWAEGLLDEHRLNTEGYFNARPIRTMWEEHLSGKRNYQYCLWDILMFQAWLQKTSTK